MPSTHLYAGFLYLLADPLGFEDPPLGILVATWTRLWLDIFAVTAPKKKVKQIGINRTQEGISHGRQVEGEQ
jgi:hypothetical protein